MKKLLLLIIVVFCVMSSGCAQTPPKQPVQSEEQPSAGNIQEKLPLDPKLRYGRLSNGLTYYIRHNELPKERAEFYIVQNVGSMQEEDNQRGLAHFLEHMAFNGSKHFPAKTGIQDWCESAGMKFGDNLNAYTGFDETVYTLMNVPVASNEVIDSCLLILHDWSSSLLLTDEAIEKERGVIREEWRTRSGAQMRIWEQQLPVIYPKSKYGLRLPIGDINIVNNFKSSELHDYYKKWYRPDLQAVIIVGDIDVDRLEAKIKTVFEDVPAAPVNAATREKYGVPDNDKPLVSIATDKEMTSINLDIYYKHASMPEALKGTIADFVSHFSRNVISMIMSERFADIVQKPDPPFVAAWAEDGSYVVSKTKDAWTSGAVVKEGGLERAMNALVAETERAKQYGFTEAEYERAKSNILKAYESAYNERDKNNNSSIAEEYIGHFTNGNYTPGIEFEYELIKKIAPQFPLDGINHYVKQLFSESEGNRNIVITLTGPEKAGLKYPSEGELLAMFRKATGTTVEAKTEERSNKVLIKNLPPKGKIVSKKQDKLFGATEYTLSNGVRVVVKATDYKQDEIQLSASSPGGLTLFKDDKDVWNKKVINNVVMLGGLGDFSATDLMKQLAGKNVQLRAGIGDETEQLRGSASPSDLKTLFELIYLQMTSIRTDDDAYQSFEERIKTQLANAQLNPMTAFSDTMTAVAYNNNPKNNRIKIEDFDKVDYHRMLAMYKERFADASDFVFTFVGNVNHDSICPLMEQYLATLPTLHRIEKGDPDQITPFVKGHKERHFSRKLETPKATVALLYSGQLPFSLREMLTGQLLSNILDLVYLEKIRQDESASYGVQSNVSLYDFPEGRTTIQIFFDTDPAKKDITLNIVKTELENIANNGPRAEHLQKSVKAILKGREEIMQENGYWLNAIETYFTRGLDSHTDYDKIMNSITVKDIKEFTGKLLEQGNRIEVVMTPE
jgi:zinc protease